MEKEALQAKVDAQALQIAQYEAGQVDYGKLCQDAKKQEETQREEIKRLTDLIEETKSEELIKFTKAEAEHSTEIKKMGSQLRRARREKDHAVQDKTDAIEKQPADFSQKESATTLLGRANDTRIKDIKAIFDTFDEALAVLKSQYQDSLTVTAAEEDSFIMLSSPELSATVFAKERSNEWTRRHDQRKNPVRQAKQKPKRYDSWFHHVIVDDDSEYHQTEDSEEEQDDDEDMEEDYEVEARDHIPDVEVDELEED